MSKKNKKICMALNYIENLLNLASMVTGCFSISAFVSLVSVPVGIASSAVGLRICAITAGINMSVIKTKKQNKIVLLAKTKLNTTDVLNSTTLMNSSIIDEEVFY